MRIYAAIDLDACRKNIDAMLAKLRPETVLWSSRPMLTVMERFPLQDWGRRIDTGLGLCSGDCSGGILSAEKRDQKADSDPWLYL